MNTINSNTLTTCQHCGKSTNFADQAHYRLLLERVQKLEDVSAQARKVLREIYHGPESAWNRWLHQRDEVLQELNKVLGPPK
jgi:hypothetical protein